VKKSKVLNLLVDIFATSLTIFIFQNNKWGFSTKQTFKRLQAEIFLNRGDP